jgi:lantibiotic modifying enzyme
MLDLFALTQLACRASNLAERLTILKQLTEYSTHLNFRSPLNKADLQAVNEDLERLFPSSAVNQPQGSFYRIKHQVVKRSLRFYRWVELNLTALSPEHQRILLEVHAPWLSHYIEAIAQVSQISNVCDLRIESIPDINVQGCFPFLKLIETELKAILEVAQQNGLEVLSHPQMVTSVQQFFWERVNPMVTNALLADTPYLQTEVENHSSFADSFHAFYLRFPVLARWLAQVSGDLIALTRQAIARLAQDRHDLSQQFWEGVAIARVTDCRFVQAQDATEEHPILQMEFCLANSQTKGLTYCPYSIQAEVGLQQLYAEALPDRVRTHSMSILAKRGYGYIEQAKQPSKLELFQEIGCHFAVRQLLGSSRGIWGQLQLGTVPRGVCEGEMPWPSGIRSPQNLNMTKTESQSFNAEEAIHRGFQIMDQWLRRQPQLAARALNTHFAYASAQLCHRPTAAYLKIFKTVQSAPCLANPLAVDTVFRTLSPCRWDGLGELVQLEVKMLWQFKALWLTIPMNHRYILYEAEHTLFSKLPISPLNYLSKRVQKMGAQDCPPKQRDDQDETLRKLLV